MELIKKEISKLLSEIIKVSEQELYNDFTFPPDSKMGDLSFACFKYSKTINKKPNEVALFLKEKIIKNIKSNIFIEDIKNIGPYLNFFINRKLFFNYILNKVFGDEYFNFEKNDKKIIVEFSSPNIAKPIAFHHIRSTVIGNVVANIYNYCGYEVFKINYLGDWGTQFGKLITAYTKYGNTKELEEKGIKHLLDIYVKYHKEAEQNPNLAVESRAWFKKMEEKNPEALSYWDLFKSISIEEFKKIYSRLNISFDFFDGESLYRESNVIDLLEEKIGLKNSEEAVVIDLEAYNLKTALIKKSDGTSLYLTRDIAAVIDRYSRFNFDECLYVVAHQQELHFKQFFKILDLLNFSRANNCKHISFGLLIIDDKKMSSRDGTMVFLETVLNKAATLAKDLIETKNADIENKEDLAEKIGVSAIIFNDISRRRNQNINFKWEEILNFDGETGPYIQYTYARICSLLKKVNVNNYKDLLQNIDYKINDIEFEIIKTISLFKEKIIQAKTEAEPFLIARYILDLSKLFNRFYYTDKILYNDSIDEKNSKVLIVFLVQKVLGICFDIVGISKLERM